jgi:hypothetical protein
VSGFAVGGNIWDALGREKWLKISGGSGGWCQVLEGTLGALGLIEELKSPCGYRSFAFWLNLIIKSRHLTRVTYTFVWPVTITVVIIKT